MSKPVKSWLIAAALLILVGCILFTCVGTSLHWNLENLATVAYQTNTYTITDTFNSICLLSDTANISFAPSPDEICQVTCFEAENEKHSVTVQDGTLYIQLENNKAWWDYIGIDFHTSAVTVQLPQGQYDSLMAKVSTGDVHIADMHVDNLDISVSTGDVSLTDITCTTLRSTGSTGNITMTNVVSADSFQIQRSTGGVHFDRCDAPQIQVDVNTGDVTGSLCTEKEFVIKTSTGDVDVPNTVVGGGICQVTSSTGDILLEIAP